MSVIAHTLWLVDFGQCFVEIYRSVKFQLIQSFLYLDISNVINWSQMSQAKGVMTYSSTVVMTIEISCISVQQDAVS